MKAVIIDDQILFRNSLKKMLEEHCPNIEVIAEADGVQSGYECILNNDFDILFLDVVLSDGSGFDILLKLKSDQLKFKIIFTTGDDRYALKALKMNANYILKPICPTDLKEAVLKVSISKSNSHKPFVQNGNVINTVNEGKKLALATAERIQIFDIDDIIRCESIDNYTYFYFRNHKRLLITRTLKEYEELLKHQNFVRVHRSHLINMNRLKSFERQKGNYMIMEDGTEIPVSQRKKETVLNILKTLVF